MLHVWLACVVTEQVAGVGQGGPVHGPWCVALSMCQWPVCVPTCVGPRWCVGAARALHKCTVWLACMLERCKQLQHLSYCTCAVLRHELARCSPEHVKGMLRP
jgi:hypothetical protein